MKKIILLLVTLLLVSNFAVTCVAQTTEKIVRVNEVTIGETVTIGGEIYVPLSNTLRQNGYEATWDGSTQSITAKNDYLSVIFVMDEKIVTVNGLERKVRRAPVLHEGTAYLPLSIMNETVNLKSIVEGDFLHIEENDDYSSLGYVTKQQRVVALMYHHILSEEEKQNGWETNGAVNTVESFEDQMQYIAENNYKTITCKELEDFIYLGKPLRQSKNQTSVLITFDDGYLSNYTHAYPIMQKYDINGVVFHVTSNTSAVSIDEIDISKLERFSVDQMITSTDVFEHELHSHAGHDKVDGIADYIWMSKAEILDDISVNKSVLPKTSSKRYFAYPFGDYDSETIEALKEANIKLAFTVNPGYITSTSDPYELNRFGVFPWVKQEQFEGYLEN